MKSYNKKRVGSFNAIFEAFKKDVPFSRSAVEKPFVDYEKIKNSIVELMKQLPEEERRRITGG